MWEQCEGFENKPIPIEKLHSFKRMRRFQPYSAVVAALRDSKFLQVVGDEGKEKVNRKNPYKPVPTARAKHEASTVYAKGFGDETPTTQFDLESFFAKFAEVKGLKLRRDNDGLFKGSVFVTFADQETADNFVKQDPAPKWGDQDLKIMTKQAYCNEKSDLIRQGKLEPNATGPKKFYEGKDSTRVNSDRRGGGRGGRGPRDSDDWKSRRDNDQRNGSRGGRGRGRGRGGRDRGSFNKRNGGHGDRDRNEERRNGVNE